MFELWHPFWLLDGQCLTSATFEAEPGWERLRQALWSRAWRGGKKNAGKPAFFDQSRNVAQDSTSSEPHLAFHSFSVL